MTLTIKKSFGKVASESMEQIMFVTWMRKTHPSFRIFHIPNGGTRDIRTAARLKTEGVSAGVPDLFIPALALWIEMKRANGGVVSPEQESWIAYLRGYGYIVDICNGCNRAIEAVQKRMLDVAQEEV